MSAANALVANDNAAQEEDDEAFNMEADVIPQIPLGESQSAPSFPTADLDLDGNPSLGVPMRDSTKRVVSEEKGWVLSSSRRKTTSAGSASSSKPMDEADMLNHKMRMQLGKGRRESLAASRQSSAHSLGVQTPILSDGES